MKFFAVILLGSQETYCTDSLKEGLAMVKFLFNKGRAARLIRVSVDRTLDITPDYVRQAYPHLFPTEFSTN